MEFSKKEMEVLERVEGEQQAEAIELADLQLCLVGGGTTDVTFY
ncbi:MAG: hypothetical protein ACM3SO_21860 [Betaproteobacteria bacterium]